MSVKKAERKYGLFAVNGSMAYDLGREDVWGEYEYGRPLDIPAAQEVEDEVVSTARVASVQAVSPLAILGFGLAAVLIVFSLFARIQLSELADQCGQLESQFTQLEDEQAKLLIAYESAFNLTEIEDYAIGTLGMQKPRSDQIHYINGQTSDRAEVLSTGEDISFADKLCDAVASFMSYFTGKSK